MDKLSINRSERRKNRTREAILAATRELMMGQGYRYLTIAAITEWADVGYGTFYLHFKDKDDAAWAVLAEYAEATRQLLNAQLAEIPPPRREYLSWVAFFRAAGVMRHNARIIFSESPYLLRRYTDFIVQMHEEHISAGFLSPRLELPPVVLAQIMGGSLMRLLMWWIETDSNYTPEEMGAMMYEAIYREKPPE